MNTVLLEQPFEINALRVARDIISPEDIFSRLSVQNILVGLSGTTSSEHPDVSLITPGQSSRAMRGGPTLDKLFHLYDELAEVVNALNAKQPYLEGALGAVSLMGKIKHPGGRRGFVAVTFSEALNGRLVSEEGRLRTAAGLRMPDAGNVSHASVFQVYDRLEAEQAAEGLGKALAPGEKVVLGSAYIEPVFLRGENFKLQEPK